MKHKRKVSFFIIITAVLMVCSVSVFAVSSTLTASAVSVTLGMNGAERSVTSVNTLQTLNFNANISGYSDFDFDISVPSQNLDSAVITLRAKFQINTDNWRYFDTGEITTFSAVYNSGATASFSGTGNSTLQWSSSGKIWWCDISCTASFSDVRNISKFVIEMDLDDLRNVDVIISTMLSWFTVEFDAPVSPSDEIFNDFSGFGDDADAVDGSEQQIKDEISNYQPEVDSFLNGFSTIVGELTVPLRAVTLMINDYVSGIPFLELLLRFSLSLGVILLLFGLGSVVVSGVSSGVRSAHREADRAKEAAERSADRREIMRMRREEHDIRMDHYRR